MKQLKILLALVYLSGLSLAQWIQQNSGTTEQLNDVVMLDQQTAIVVGNNGIILKTTDSGLNWQQKFYQSGLKWNAVAFKAVLNGIVVGNNQRIATTNDAGENWTLSDSSGQRHFLSVTYMASYRIYIGNDRGKVIYSDDNGSTWNEIYFGSNPINSIFFTETAYLYHYGYIVTPWLTYKTNDSGFSWTSLSVPITIWGAVEKGEFTPDGNIAYVVGMDGHLWVEPIILRKTSTDSAWQKYIFSPPFIATALNDISAPSSQFAYTCGSFGKILSTKDGGSTWSQDSTSVTNGLNAIDFFNDSTGFTVGESGTILYTSNGGITAIDGNKNNTPQKFMLYQNYPNPFNTKTLIRYDLSINAYIDITVYDILGKEIVNPVNSNQERGSHEVHFDGSLISSGIYFCRIAIHSDKLRISRNMTKTIKIILMK